MRIRIIRHADPDYSIDSLTPFGHVEAKHLAEHLALEGITRIHCSPLGRAKRTMQYTAEKTGLTPTIEHWTQEISGLVVEDALIGECCLWNVSGEKFRTIATLPGHSDWHQHPMMRDTPVADIYEKMMLASDAFLAGLGYRREGTVYRIVESNREDIALFCHLGFGLAWLAHLLAIPLPLVWTGFFIPPSSVTTVLFEERSGDFAVPRCTGLGDVSHLHKNGVRFQPSGLMANQD